jgi:HD-GYP domain-containing protein (c-di-GMP phosphodiesterase class II)
MLEARILAVADKLEAMMAFRPYRAAPGMDAAIRTLTQGRGTRFDPAVVDACLRVVNKPGYEATAS